MESVEQLKTAYNYLEKEMLTWFELSVRSIPNLIVAAFVLVLFFFIGRALKKLVSSTSERITDNAAASGVLANLSFIVILLIGTSLSLGILNLDKTVSSLLAGAGVIGLAIGFAFQEIFANFISGIILAFRRPVRISDVVEISGTIGKVKSMNLRTTVIENFTGQEVYIPNKTLITEKLVNYSKSGYRRLELKVGVSYSDDLDVVEKIAEETLSNISLFKEGYPCQVYFTGFGDSSIDLIIRYWIDYPGDHYFTSTHEVVKKLKKAFDSNGISIPFPIRTIDLGIDSTESIMSNVVEMRSSNPIDSPKRGQLKN